MIMWQTWSFKSWKNWFLFSKILYPMKRRLWQVIWCWKYIKHTLCLLKNSNAKGMQDIWWGGMKEIWRVVYNISGGMKEDTDHSTNKQLDVLMMMVIVWEYRINFRNSPPSYSPLPKKVTYVEFYSFKII